MCLASSLHVNSKASKCPTEHAHWEGMHGTIQPTSRVLVSTRTTGVTPGRDVLRLWQSSASNHTSLPGQAARRGRGRLLVRNDAGHRDGRACTGTFEAASSMLAMGAWAGSLQWKRFPRSWRPSCGMSGPQQRPLLDRRHQHLGETLRGAFSKARTPGSVGICRRPRGRRPSNCHEQHASRQQFSGPLQTLIEYAAAGACRPSVAAQIWRLRGSERGWRASRSERGGDLTGGRLAAQADSHWRSCREQSEREDRVLDIEARRRREDEHEQRGHGWRTWRSRREEQRIGARARDLLLAKGRGPFSFHSSPSPELHASCSFST
ncbi:hypothetical protein VTO73DRAFT_11782 [Trametes versicolor]